jgi:hypothetical protein
MAASLPLFALLSIPILALGMNHLYSWMDIHAHFHHAEEIKQLEHKAGYLSKGFFAIRTAVYFLVTGFIAQRLFGWSTRQDASGDARLTARQRALSAGGLPFVAIVFAFAAFDWIMSLNPLWFSTMFGVYYFAGSFVSTFCVLAIAVARAQGRNLFGDYVSPEHSHNIGKLMLAFTAFWAYIAFSQFMLIWIANLPEEIPFFTLRMKGSWAYVGVGLIVFHFFVPFFTLLSRNIKRKPSRLVPVAVWLLLMHFVDLYWLILPTFHPEAPAFHWSLVTAFAGMGLLAVGFTVWRLRGHFTVPVKDPFLPVSLGYRQP